MDPLALKPIERTARFVYLNRHCFNGVYRVNRAGHFNVPRGTRTGCMPTVADFSACAAVLKRAELRATDYRDCLRDTKAGDFVYLDPPYASQRRNTFGEYGYNCFSESDLPQLKLLLHRIDRLGAVFLLSYSIHEAFADLPSQWHCRTLEVRRHVAGFAKHRRSVLELVISNRPLERTS
jgi:DNA adenine methylase